jgi:hypothetical protein
MMIIRYFLICVLVCALVLIVPASGHVPVSADNNDNINAAFFLEKPIKSYAIYGHLHDAGEVAYYQFRMNAGDRLSLSLMTSGYNKPVPDLIVMSPGMQQPLDEIPSTISVPAGYGTEIIKGQKPLHAEYEPFSPGAIFKVATYSKEITTPGIYYVAVVSPADETRYSIAVGYLEEFSPGEWVLIPINVMSTHLWEGQSIIAILAPFLAVVVFGFIIIARREQRKGTNPRIAFWLTTVAGLFYMGGAAITVMQMIRAMGIAGPSPAIVLTLFFALIPIVLGLWALRIARSPAPRSLQDRIFLVLIGVLGLVFWAGLVVGPVIAFIAAVSPATLQNVG